MIYRNIDRHVRALRDEIARLEFPQSVDDRLAQLGCGVIQVYFGGGADDPQRFRNKRAEMFWWLREGMEKGEISLPDDDDVRADLSALRYMFTQDGRI